MLPKQLKIGTESDVFYNLAIVNHKPTGGVVGYIIVDGPTIIPIDRRRRKIKLHCRRNRPRPQTKRRIIETKRRTVFPSSDRPVLSYGLFNNVLANCEFVRLIAFRSLFRRRLLHSLFTILRHVLRLHGTIKFASLQKVNI